MSGTHTNAYYHQERTRFFTGHWVSSLAGMSPRIYFQKKHSRSQISPINARKERVDWLAWTGFYFLRRELFMFHKVAIDKRANTGANPSRMVRPELGFGTCGVHCTPPPAGGPRRYLLWVAPNSHSGIRESCDPSLLRPFPPAARRSCAS